MENNILIAMSGGVDSSVSALLMKEKGYNCLGATMKLYDSDNIDTSMSKTCCSLRDVEDARSVCTRLGIEYRVFNFIEKFKSQVIDKFVASYEEGLTPNPCIDCNRYLKFKDLYNKARVLGFDKVVTGHYAQVEKIGDRYYLKKAVDETKDQTYFLYDVTQEQLSHIVFPLGGFTKDKVREIAEKNGLINARKRDSQDICFVPDGNYSKFIRDYAGKTYPKGPFLNMKGEKIGEHKGIINYTIGQRRGLGVSADRPLYVHSKDVINNTVTLCYEEDLDKKEFYIKNVNYLFDKTDDNAFRAKVKTRYRQKEQWATIIPKDDNMAKVILDEPQKAIAPGQATVFYKEEYVLGGGEII